MIGKILYCAIVAALYDPNGYAESYVAEIYVLGKVIKETDEMYFLDFSEDIGRFPIIGTPKNYSNVEVEKEKCRL